MLHESVNEQVQIALKNFSFRRCYPLEIIKFSVAHQGVTVGRNQLKRLDQLSVCSTHCCAVEKSDIFKAYKVHACFASVSSTI